MADVKITALDAHTAPADTDVLPIVDVDPGATKKITVAALRTSIGIAAEERTKLDGIEALADVTDAANVEAAGAVMTSRTISTTAPLAGGGALSGDLTLSISPATTDAAGSMSGEDKTKLDGIASGATANTASSSTPAASVGAGTAGAATAYARGDHAHPATATLATEATTARSVANADSGKVIRCTAATTVTITVPSGLTAGTTVEYVQEGAGQVQVTGSGVTLRHGAGFLARTAEQWSSIVVTVLDSDEALVRGDLEAA